MQKKSILHLTGMTSTKYGGVERYLLELTRLCHQKGYHTTLQYETLPQSKTYQRELQSLGAEIAPIATHVSPLQCVKRVFELVYTVHPTILHTHFVNRYVYLSIPLIARLMRVEKVIGTIHSEPHFQKKSPRRFALNQFDRILGVSNAVVENILFAGVNPKRVSPHYLGLLGEYAPSKKLRREFRTEFSLSEQKTVLACIGFDMEVKGLDILLKALKRVLLKHPQIALIIIGVDPASSKLPHLAEELEISQHVHWAGIRDEGWQLLNAADIYVQPSRSEGLPLAIMEAMALGLPVVATHVGGIPEAVIDGKTGYLANEASSGSLAAVLDRMLTERPKWKIIGEAGHLRYQRYFKGGNSARELIEKYYGLED